jgi:hypothetical protein
VATNEYYNVVVFYENVISFPNNTMKDDPEFYALMDDPRSAQVIAEEIFEKWCVKGVFVFERYVGEHVSGFATGYYQQSGKYHTIGYWAVDFFCDKTHPIIPTFPPQSLSKNEL